MEEIVVSISQANKDGSFTHTIEGKYPLKTGKNYIISNTDCTVNKIKSVLDRTLKLVEYSTKYDNEVLKNDINKILKELY